MSGRHAAPFVRDVLARFRLELLSASDAIAELALSRSRFYTLYSDYLRACAERRQRSRQPGHSGGNHRPAWAVEVLALLRKLLSTRPPASYSFAASEVHRRHHFKIDRATVRRWALAQGLAPDTKHKKQRKPVRRWQVQQIGQLWQDDTSPHRWFTQSDRHCRCLKSSMITVGCCHWPGYINGKSSSLIWTSFPAPLSPAACRWLCMSITIPFSSPISPTPLPNSVPPFASTRSLYASLPLRRQKVKSNALTTSGRNDFHPCLPPSKSPLSRKRISSSTNSVIITTSTKSIVRSDPPQEPLGISLSAKNDPFYALYRDALGGPTFGASVLPLASIPMVVSPSLANVCASTNLPVPELFVASTPTAITPFSPPLRTRTLTLFDSSTAHLQNLSCFDRTLLSCFECNATPSLPRLAITRSFREDVADLGVGLNYESCSINALFIVFICTASIRADDHASRTTRSFDYSNGTTTSSRINVEISGAVHKSGLWNLKAETSLNDLLKLADWLRSSNGQIKVTRLINGQKVRC